MEFGLQAVIGQPLDFAIVFLELFMKEAHQGHGILVFLCSSF